MSFFRWRRTTQKPARPRFRPEVTALEDRNLMAVFGGINFPGLAQIDRIEPPDTSLAAGPNQVVEVVNERLAIYDKSTRSLLFSSSLLSFFGPTRGPSANGDLFSPVVLFDEGIQRFVVSVLDVSDTDRRSFLNVAVSNTPDAINGFDEIFRIETTETSSTGEALWADSPKVGGNAEAVVFAFNMFTFPTGAARYDHAQIVSLDKSLMLDRNPGTVSFFSADRPGTDFGLATAYLHDPTPGGPVFFVEEGTGDRASVRVLRMDEPLSGIPIFNEFAVAVPGYAAPTPPQQPGGSSPDPSIDSRILNAVGRAGSLYATHNVGTGVRTVARFYQIDVTGPVPRLVQFGDVDRGAGIDTYYPAIEVSSGGDVGLSFIQSSAREFMSMYITARKTGDALGVLQTPQLIKAGESVYNGVRAGSYSGISVDPGNFPTFWAANQYAVETNGGVQNWGTWVVNFVVDVPEPNSIISRSRQFISQVYLDVLLRPVDPSGLAFWSSLVDQGVPRTEIVEAITFSREYLTNVVNGFYRAFLGRNADAGGLNGFVDFLARGGTSDRVQSAILSSPEYASRNGGPNNNLAYVRSLYVNVLGRAADAGGETYFTRLLAAGIPRENIAFMIVTSQEAKTRLVGSYYTRFLRRGADAGGLNFYVSSLVRGSQLQQNIVTSDGGIVPTRNEDVISAIVGSFEYFARL